MRELTENRHADSGHRYRGDYHSVIPAYARTLDITENDVIRTEDADIVVVGSGSAGTFAAVRAAERGARVIAESCGREEQLDALLAKLLLSAR